MIMAITGTEGNGLARNLAVFGIQAKYVGGNVAPQLFRFNFEIEHGQPTRYEIIKAVERLRIRFGKYEYADTPTGKGFSIIRTVDTPSTVYLDYCANFALEAKEKDPNGLQKGYICFGEDTYGNHIVKSLYDCKSILVAGTAGSGKSVCLNSIIIQILATSNAKLLLIDPKQVEFNVYAHDIHNRIHNIAKTPTDIINSIKWAHNEMEMRYSTMSANCLDDYYTGKRLVVVIDELASIMLNYKDEVESLLCDIAAKGRAAGVHLIIATQNPCAQIVTGNIKYNMQTVICLKTMNAMHSMNIIDVGDGAKLIGRGDAYIKFEDNVNLVRIQTPFISKERIFELCTEGTKKEV